MLLNYFYANFLEEHQFVDAAETTAKQLAALIAASVFPKPSYVYHSDGRTSSFVAECSGEQTYRFHLR